VSDEDITTGLIKRMGADGIPEQYSRTHSLAAKQAADTTHNPSDNTTVPQWTEQEMDYDIDF